MFEPGPGSSGIWHKHACPSLPILPAIPEDIAFALEEKRKYFWGLRWSLKADTSFNIRTKTKLLPGERRRREVLEGFESYRKQLEPLVDDAVVAFVDLISRLENIGFRERIALVHNNIHDCLIQPTVERDSIARWLLIPA